MLISMTVRNIALIESLTIEFHRGMHVLSGETGAGKSILVDSINLVLGERADRSLIRSGCEKASVEALIDISDCPRAREILAEQELSDDHGLLTIQREITGERNICRQQQAVEILAPAGAEILAGPFPDEPFHLVQLPGDGKGKPQFFRDGQIALPYPAKNRLDVFAVSLGAVGLVEQVGDFFILRKTPPGRAGHHVAAARIHSDNITHFSELSCVRQGTAAEFDHNFSHGIVSSNITES